MKAIQNNVTKGAHRQIVTDILKTAITCLLPIHLVGFDIFLCIAAPLLGSSTARHFTLILFNKSTQINVSFESPA
jgi:hypothetical protein